MAGECGVCRLEVGGGGRQQSRHGRDHTARHLHDCTGRHSFGIVVSCRRGRYDLVWAGGQAGVHTGPGRHGPRLAAGRAGRAACVGPRGCLGGGEDARGGGSGSVSEESLRVPARHPGIVGEGQHSRQARQVLLARPTEGHRVRRGEAAQLAQLTGGGELEVLLLQEQLLLRVQAGGELLVAVNSLGQRRTVSTLMINTNKLRGSWETSVPCNFTFRDGLKS